MKEEIDKISKNKELKEILSFFKNQLKNGEPLDRDLMDKAVKLCLPAQRKSSNKN